MSPSRAPNPEGGSSHSKMNSRLAGLCEIDETLGDDTAADAGELLAEYRTYLLKRITRVTEYRLT